MGYFCCKERISKARTKVKGDHRLSALSKQMAGQAQANLFKGLRTWKKGINPEDMLTAFRSGSYSGMMATIPWLDLPEHLQPFQNTMDKSVSKATEFSFNALPAPVKSHLRFDINNPRLRKFIGQHTGELVVNIHKETQEIIQAAVHESFTHALTPKDVANKIKDSIGLDPRRAMALDNFKFQQTLSGNKPSIQERHVNLYSERLLNDRAMTIARTETREATNQGQLSVWREAANQDLINRKTAKKVWVISSGACELCEPMDGVAVALDDVWVLDDGTVCEVPSDSHPNCFCGMQVQFDEEE